MTIKLKRPTCKELCKLLKDFIRDAKDVKVEFFPSIDISPILTKIKIASKEDRQIFDEIKKYAKTENIAIITTKQKRKRRTKSESWICRHR